VVRLGLRCVKAARGTKATGSANGIGELVYSHEPRVLNALNHHLCNSIAALEVNGVLLVGVQERHCNFAPVACVNSAWSIDDGKPVLGGKPRAGVDQCHESIRERKGNAGRDEFPLPWGEVNVLPRPEVCPGIARVRIGRRFQPDVEHFQLHFQGGGSIGGRRLTATNGFLGGVCTEYCGLIAHSGSFYCGPQTKDLGLPARPTVMDAAATPRRISWRHAYA
jgi:hypothetical protein